MDQYNHLSRYSLMSMQDYFYRDKAGREIGPLALDTLAKFRSAGVLDGDTPVRAGDSAEWKPYRNIIADAPALPPAAQPTAPQPGALVPGASGRWRTKWVLVALAGLALFVILRYAISGTPSANDGERAVQDRIKQEAQGRITLAKFQKTNGQEGELLGVKMYGLEFEAEIEFTEDCKWITGFMGSQLSFRTSKLIAQPSSGFSWQKFSDDGLNPGVPVQKGQKMQVSGVIRFQKKENGWSVDGIELNRATPVVSRAQASGSRADAAVKAFETYRKQAENGDPKAQYELAKIYATGDGVETNGTAAVEWFRKAADQGYAPGQTGLGVMYLRGLGVSKDDVEAVRWFRLAADQGDAKGQVNLGGMYLRGAGVVKDHSEAVKWFKKAAESGYSGGQYTLGRAYAMGWGVEVNAAEAVKWFRKAAEQNESAAQDSLGEMYEEGRGVPMSKEMAVEWYRKATNAGNSHAIMRLRQLFPTPEDASIQCCNNLKQIGLAFRTWAIDHNGPYPFNVSSSAGGTKEWSGLGNDGLDTNAALIFQVMSNELSTPNILVCPSDSTRHPAPSFQNLLAGNVTYKVRSGTNISEVYPSEILARCPIHGHVLKCDGSVQSAR
jgi:TPR repeat protein